MKKTLLVVLALLLSFCMVIPVLADDPAADTTKGSEVEYVVTGGYEWSVPAKTTFSGVNSNQTLNGPVKVTKCMLEDKGYLTIRVGDDENSNDFKLKNAKNDAVTLKYEVVRDASKWVPLQNKDLILRAFVGGDVNADGTLVTPVQQNLTGKIVEIPKVAGTYTDTITFVAKCDTLPTDDLTGATWVGNNTLNIRDMVKDIQSGEGNAMNIKVNNTWNGTSHERVQFIRNNGSNYWMNLKGGDPDASLYKYFDGSANEWAQSIHTIVFGNSGEHLTDKERIAWLHENGTLTPGSSEVTNLTGYKWVGNDTLDIGSFLSSKGVDEIAYSVNCSCPASNQPNRTNCIALGFNNYYADQLWVRDAINEYDTHIYYDGYYWDTSPISSETNVLIFTGGTDASNPDLIAWLQANGTLEKVSGITDLTGYQWTGKEESQLDLQTLFDKAPNAAQYYPERHHYYKINFAIPGFDGGWGCNSCKEFFIIRGSGTDDISIAVSPDTYGDESYTGYSGDPYQGYHVFVFTGGTDATNPDLIAWLQANGTLVKVSE